MRIVKVCCFVLPILTLACSDTTPVAQPTNHLTVSTPWEVTNTDPSTSGFMFLRLGIGETLVDVNEHGVITPALAISWTSSDDHKKWVFALRDDVKFHDGTPMTADHVTNCLRIALKKPTALSLAHITHINALDNHTLEIHLGQPTSALPAYLAHSTAMILAPGSFDGDKVTQVIATGAYRADTIEPPQKIEQSAFADYWGQKAHIDRISYLANSRSETRTLLVQSSPNSLVYTLDTASLARLKQDPNVQIQTRTLSRTIALKVNASHPLFADKVVRQVLSDAIDRPAIAQAVMRTDQVAAY